jgi:DeoR family galactitol utilization operon repressor
VSEKPTREAYILDQLARDGGVSVAPLSRELGVSEVTIRSDLRDLEAAGLLQRTHGGAQPSSFQTVLERQRHRRGAKQRIAAAAAALVRDGDAVMIEAGTTTALVAASLRGRQGLTVVTNSTLALAAARLDPGLRMILAGGRFHPGMESFTGSDTLNVVAGYNVRIAFVGTNGFSVEYGLTTPFTDGADVLRAMCGQAEEAWLVADSSKLGKVGFVGVLGLDRMAGVITDKGIGDGAAEEIRSLGTRVIVV